MVSDAIEFLTNETKELRRLVKFCNGKDVILDFGIGMKGEISQYHNFPAILVTGAGKLGVSLELSVYDFTWLDK